MKSRISSSNFTAFKKDITRFAPLWAVYLIGGFLVMMTLTDSAAAGGVANGLASTIGPFSVINLIYAGLAAQLLFGDLYNSRLCNALHAMPLRREQWFLCHIGAGLCFSVVPHLIVMPIVMLSMGEFWFVGLWWLLGMLLEYLFFFGLAVFSCLCVGNRFAMVAVYAILNFGSLIAYWFCATIYEPMMYGVILSSDGFFDLCPVVRMATQTDMVIMNLERVAQGTYDYYSYWTYEGLGGGWGYAVVCAVIGLALLGAALLMYRRRALESAGDFIAVKPLAPVFSVVFTLCVSAVCAMFGSLFSESFMTVFLIAGLVVGYFAGQMLLQRSAKVFRLKAFGKLGLIAAAMIISLFLVQWDAFGIVRWVPQANQVEMVTLSGRDVELTDEADIQLVINLHKEAVAQGEYRSPSNGSYHYVRIEYDMKNGRHIERRYEIAGNSKAYQALKSVYSRVSFVLGDVSDLDAYVSSIVSVEMNGYVMKENRELFRGLVEAIKADCEAGLMAQGTAYHTSDPVTHIYLDMMDSENMYYYRSISVYPDATATIAWLDENLPGWETGSGEWAEKFGY